jgi:AcrR family transcriptional regulator
METADRILAAAYEVFTEAGFRGTTMRRVAEVAGVNEVTVFRHFITKDALMVAALRRQSDRMVAALANRPLPATPTDVRAELTAYARLILGALLQSRQAHRTAIGEWGHNPDLDPYLLLTTSYVYDEVNRYLARARDAGLVRTTVDPLVATQALLGALLADAIMRDVLPAQFPLAPPATAGAYLDVLLDGLLPLSDGGGRDG